MFERIKNILVIVALIGAIFAGYAVGIDKLASATNHSRNLSSLNAQEGALADCLEFDAVHAVVVEGKAYCYKTFMGTEYIKSLDDLKEARQKQQQEQNQNPPGG